jgi:hypothetical protein
MKAKSMKNKKVESLFYAGPKDPAMPVWLLKLIFEKTPAKDHSRTVYEK